MAKKKKYYSEKITPQQKRFCREYVIDLNGKQAAIRAKYSPKTAEAQASQLLSKLKVKTYVKKLQEKLQEETNINAKKVIDEFAKIAFANMGDFITNDNEIRDLSKLSRNKLAVVESIQSDIRHDGGKSEGYTEKVKFKLHDKISALENLGKHLGIYEKDNQQRESKILNVIGMNKLVS